MRPSLTVLVLLLVALLFPGPRSAHAQEDLTAPVVHRVWAIPNNINTTEQSQEVTFYFEVTDDLSGFSGSTAMALSLRPVIHNFRATPTDQPNIYTYTRTFPRYSQYGEYRITRLIVRDEVGNRSESQSVEDEDGEVREGVCNSGRLDYSACASWLDNPLFRNGPDYSAPSVFLPLVTTDRS